MMDWMYKLCEEGILVTLGLLLAGWLIFIGTPLTLQCFYKLTKRCPFCRACGLASGVLGGH